MQEPNNKIVKVARGSKEGAPLGEAGSPSLLLVRLNAPIFKPIRSPARSRANDAAAAFARASEKDSLSFLPLRPAGFLHADVGTWVRARKTRIHARIQLRAAKLDLGRSNSPVNWATFSPYAFFTLLAYLNEPPSYPPSSARRGINYGDYRRPLGYAFSFPLSFFLSLFLSSLESRFGSS